MTPRWTVGINGSLMWWAEGDEYGPALYPVDLGAIWDAWPKDAVIEAFDALVAAVRDQARIPGLEADADTLRQARALADKACPGGLRHAIDRTAFDALLDLLAPVSSTPAACATCEDRGWVWESGESGLNQGWPADCPDCTAPQGEGT